MGEVSTFGSGGKPHVKISWICS